MSTTQTCYCGAVQIAFSIEGDNLVDTFVCNCTDCHKITASAFASNFIIKNSTMHYNRGEDKITKFAMTKTIATGNTMTNHFCSICGSLMYRVSSSRPEMAVMRIGAVDDFEKQTRDLKPRIEQFTKDRVGWLTGAEGAEQHEGNYYAEQKARRLKSKAQCSAL